MKKNFMLIAALAMVLFFVAPMTSEASEDVKGTWKVDSTGWWYEFEDGTYYKDGFYEIDEVTYYFDEVGYMATGWEKVGYEWYYFTPSGARVNEGWAAIDGKWYYFGEYGAMYECGSYEIDEKLYLFDKDGAWVSTTGWYELFYNGYDKEDSNWFYLDANSNVMTDWQFIAGKWYYFEPSNEWSDGGFMYEDCKAIIDEVEYLFGADGAWIENTGWVYSNGWYYLNANKEYVTGWQVINGEWYYFEPNKENGNYGLMYAAGPHTIVENEEVKTYFFEYSGAMVDGWYNYGDAFSKFGNWVYCNEGGTPADKWAVLGGKWYYFNDGWMQRAQWIVDEKDDEIRYYLGHDGAMVQGWYHFENVTPHSKSSSDWIYTDPATGKDYTGWIQSGKKWYYISDGIMVRSGAAFTVETPGEDEPEWSDFAGEDNSMSDEEYEAYNKAWAKYYETYEEKYETYRNSLYVFGDDGAMVSGGWYEYKTTSYSEWYYANPDGTAARGWTEIAGKWYFFDTYNGNMYTNCYVDGCWIGANGVWVK